MHDQIDKCYWMVEVCISRIFHDFKIREIKKYIYDIIIQFFRQTFFEKYPVILSLLHHDIVVSLAWVKL